MTNFNCENSNLCKWQNCVKDKEKLAVDKVKNKWWNNQISFKKYKNT